MKGRRTVYALDLLLVCLVAAEVLLVWGDVISVGQAVAAAAVMEVLLVLVGLRQAWVVTRAYRGHRAAGLDGWNAFTEGLASIMPLPVARVVALEPRMWHCFYRWVTRRPLPPGSYTYHRRSILGPLLLVVALTTPVEILAVELLVPWRWVRVLFLIGALYACFWLVAYYASLTTLPHRLLPSGLAMRFGATVVCLVPYAAITGVEELRLRPPRRAEGLHLDDDGATAWVVVGGRTDLALTLDPPQTIETFGGTKGPVSMIHLAVDRPAELATALREKLAENPASGAPAQGSSRPSGSEAAASSER